MGTDLSLQQRIIERIEREGPLTFAEYMRMALYEPGSGYYVTGAAKMGWEGDYFTSTDISASLFAHCMGRQLWWMWEKLECPARFLVLEQGSGRGGLAEGVRKWAEATLAGVSSLSPLSNPIPTREPTTFRDFYAALDYQTADIRFEQDALSTVMTSSVMLSNELVDAFPVHIVEVRDRHLYEVYVDVRDGRLYEVLDEPSTPEVAGYLDSFKVPWQTYDDYWRAEINLDAPCWIERMALLLRRGFILTIDYGEKARALYTRWRRQGTLACYYKHRVTERPLVRPGEQDITAHVNFSALINEGRRHGLRLNLFTTQRSWLEQWGIHEELARLRLEQFAAADTERATDRGQVALWQWYDVRQRVAALTDPAGMGNFKVLILRR